MNATTLQPPSIAAISLEAVEDAAFTGNQPKDSADPVHDFLPNNPIYQGEEQQKNGWMVCNP